MKKTHELRAALKAIHCIAWCGKKLPQKPERRAEEDSRSSSGYLALSAEEIHVVEDLAWMVNRSSQNVGTRMKDKARQVLEIFESKRTPMS